MSLDVSLELILKVVGGVLGLGLFWKFFDLLKNADRYKDIKHLLEKDKELEAEIEKTNTSVDNTAVSDLINEQNKRLGDKQ